MTLNQRIEAAAGFVPTAGGDGGEAAWASLMRLFRADREAFYLLACGGAAQEVVGAVAPLADYAALVRKAVRESYKIVTGQGQAWLVSATGERRLIPIGMVPEVTHFLREVDGKRTSLTPGKDYVGSASSEAEVRFKLGERADWHVDEAAIDAERHSQPLVFQISGEETENLKFQPAYATYGLMHCARKTVLAPTAVFKGLRRGDSCPSDLQGGWAFCGKPRQAFGNDGHPAPAPAGMVYLAYADEERYIFDWDWVKEDPHQLGFPVDSELRFDDRRELSADAVLDLPADLHPGTFDAARACYSTRGDCIFCYISDAPSFAERINSDLTIFKRLEANEVTGFKVKNVRRIVEKDHSILLSDAPDITVSVRRALVATLKGHADTEARIYELIIAAVFSKVREDTNVRLPRVQPQIA